MKTQTHAHEGTLFDGYRRFEPEAQYFKFDTIGQQVDGSLMTPIVLPDPDGKERTRFRLRLCNGRTKILPSNAVLIATLEQVMAECGVGANVSIVFTGTKPSKKGAATKLFEVHARPAAEQLNLGI